MASDAHAAAAPFKRVCVCAACVRRGEGVRSVLRSVRSRARFSDRSVAFVTISRPVVRPLVRSFVRGAVSVRVQVDGRSIARSQLRKSVGKFLELKVDARREGAVGEVGRGL